MDFVEEPEVDVVGAEGGEAAVEGGFGLRGGESGALLVVGGGTLAACARRCLKPGRRLDRLGAAMRRPAVDEGGFLAGRMPYFVVTVTWPRMVLEKFAEAALGFAVAVHGSYVEVADAGVVGGLEEAQ